VYPEHHSLRRLSPAAIWRNRFQTEWTSEPVPTLRRHGWNVWSRLRWGLQGRIETAVDLAEQYIERRGRPDVVHAHSAQWAAAAAARLEERTGIPYVVTEHFSGFREDRVFAWQWPIIREGLDNASGIACVSRSLKSDLVTQGLASPTDVNVVPNPVDTTFFRPPDNDPFRKNRPPRRLRLLAVGRLIPNKRIDLLLRALTECPDPVSATIVGDGPDAGSLRRLARQLGLSNRVRFEGRQDRRGVRRQYWRADALVVPSRVETFGLVLVEAMATGLPTVATRSGGPEDIITPTTGLLVPPDNRDALATAVTRLHDGEIDCFDPETIRSVAVDRYSPDAFVQQTRSLYERACSRTTAPSVPADRTSASGP
jgi:glycosyltransferase involved in cell wall biosynthesis